jgi:hypothetical protein
MASSDLKVNNELESIQKEAVVDSLETLRKEEKPLSEYPTIRRYSTQATPKLLPSEPEATYSQLDIWW